MQKEESEDNYVTNLQIDGVSVGLPQPEQLIILPPQLAAAQDGLVVDDNKGFAGTFIIQF